MLTLPSAHNLPITRGFLRASRNLNYGQQKAHAGSCDALPPPPPFPPMKVFVSGFLPLAKQRDKPRRDPQVLFLLGTSIVCDKTGRKAAQPNNARPAFKQQQKGRRTPEPQTGAGTHCSQFRRTSLGSTGKGWLCWLSFQNPSSSLRTVSFTAFLEAAFLFSTSKSTTESPRSYKTGTASSVDLCFIPQSSVALCISCKYLPYC